MSADLLKEFEDFYQPAPTSNAPLSTGAGSHQGLANAIASQPSAGWPSIEQVEDDDDFGDFETAQEDRNHGSTVYAENQSKLSTARLAAKPTVSRPVTKPRDENVLFDAEDPDELDEVDDFGDFEGAATEAVAPVKQPRNGAGQQRTSEHSNVPPPSLIDFDDFGEVPQTITQKETASAVRSFEQPVSREVSKTGGTGEARQTTKTTKTTRASRPAGQHREPQPETAEDTSAWDDFEESEPVQISHEAQTPGSTVPAAEFSSETQRNSDTDTELTTLHLEPLMPQSSSPDTSLPPTNVPPPALLISLFPSLASRAQKDLFDPLAQFANDHDRRDSIISQQTTKAYISSLLELLIVLAHIIAGRKQRWKRDTILSQSMRIGPASSSGKGGGMKLAGVDKAENAREERETAEAVRAWRLQIGRVRSAASGAGLGAVVDVAETLPVRVAAQSEGAVLSAKACALCGLKRNERVAKVDVEVQDSFGEWWIEHWGHRSCKNFWDSPLKDLLKSR